MRIQEQGNTNLAKHVELRRAINSLIVTLTTFCVYHNNNFLQAFKNITHIESELKYKIK